MPNIVHPIVHLNGSSRRALLEQREAIHRALTTCLDMLAQGAPHMRDYYVSKDPELYMRASEQYADRYSQIRSIQEDIETEIAALEPQLAEIAGIMGGCCGMSREEMLTPDPRLEDLTFVRVPRPDPFLAEQAPAVDPHMVNYRADAKPFEPQPYVPPSLLKPND